MVSNIPQNHMAYDVATTMAPVVFPGQPELDALRVWQQLDQFLWHYRDLWQFHPFASPPAWWQHELGAWLRQQTPATDIVGDWLPDWPKAVDDYQAALQAGVLASWQADVPAEVPADVPSGFAPCPITERPLKDHPSKERLSKEQSVTDWPVPEWRDPAPVADQLPFWLSQAIGGRKWQQILQFLAQLPPLPSRVIEWCAGKGHLGMAVAAMDMTAKDMQAMDVASTTAPSTTTPHGNSVPRELAPPRVPRQVLSVEWQASLCQQGQERAARHQLSQQFITVDVLAEPLPANVLVQPSVPRLLALHACGDLHRRALQLVRQQQWPATIVPCCYHLQAALMYQPLSQQVKQTRLQLHRADLKLAVQGQHTGGQRILQLRQREVWWRLAYQLWRSTVLGDAKYQPLNSIPKQWLSGEFAAFLQYAAAQQGVPNVVISTGEAEQYLQQSWPRYIEVQQLERVKHWFQPVLELWLILDRAFYMAEDPSVSQVQVLPFCQETLTPRRFMLQSIRKEAAPPV